MSISELSQTHSHVRPAHAVAKRQSAAAEPAIALVRDDVYAVLDSRLTMGFVERVGNVYVAMFGDRQLKAVEVGQSLSWDVAVDMVCIAYRRRSTPAS